jgi:holo-[acyl-carrier protein] synthase
MEIVGIGTEIVECLRIGRMVEQHGEVFLTRVFTSHEIQFCQARRKAKEYFAAYWAAKEAIIKSLGITWNHNLNWTDIEIHTDLPGQHEVRLAGTIRELAEQGRVGRVLLSTSHCRAYATAYALALRV